MIDLPHEALLFALGGVILLVAWLPLLLKRLPLSLPIVGLGIGYALSFTPWWRANVGSLQHDETLEQLNEGVVLIALMGAGLRLDRPFGWRNWASTWRLLAVGMPLTMIAVFVGAYWLVGLSAAAALLLAASLAPTDPVLAADVQTGPPSEGEDGETRFGLTSEAGLNDGLAFPFILLAIAAQQGAVHWGHWLGVELLADLAIGVAIGWVAGWATGYLMFRLPTMKLSDTGDGLVAVGVTFLTYALTSAIHGNGFVAVFVAALTIRSTCPEDDFHKAMSEFSGQVERILLIMVIIAFGWALGRGVLDPIGWQGALLAIGIVLVVRPAAAMIAFLGGSQQPMSKQLMAFFGIRGIGTLFYLQYAFNRAAFPEMGQVWAIASLTVLCSILLHGVTSTPLMARADARRKEREHRENDGKDEAVAEAGCA